MVDRSKLFTLLTGFLGLGIIVGGIIIIFLIHFGFATLSPYVSFPFFFFGLVFLGIFYHPNFENSTMFFIVEMAWFCVFTGFLELVTGFYGEGWVTSLFYVGVAILIFLTRTRIEIIALDSLYVLGVSSIILTLIFAGFGITIEVYGLIEMIARGILGSVNEIFDGVNLSLGKDFWIAERVLYGLLSIWYVDHIRESSGIVDGKNISKYSSFTRIVIGIGMVLSALALPILGKVPIIVALVIGCAGLFFAYPLIKMLKTEQSQRYISKY